MNQVHFSSKTPEWSTPQTLFDELDKEFNFTLDPCATPENAKCKKFFTKEHDGLKQSWRNEIVFCNPPYGREIGKWVEKAFMTNQLNLGDIPIVMLLPARTDTKYFHDYIYGKSEIRFIKGRLKFGDSRNSAPFPSMIVVFKTNK
jgi:site-specific DNA-methyltransferase (adenine-specific)